MKLKEFLYPTISFKKFKHMISLSIIGALIAGTYGILHDQITYSISSEYFTHLKFYQFEYADFGLHNRFFVTIIGFFSNLVGWFF